MDGDITTLKDDAEKQRFEEEAKIKAPLEEEINHLRTKITKLEKEKIVYIATAPGRDGAMAKLKARITELEAKNKKLEEENAELRQRLDSKGVVVG